MAKSMTKVKILIPIFEDFSCISILYKKLKKILSSYNLSFLVIDDGSYNELEIKRELELNPDLEFLTLSQNLGHQRSIAIGLCHLSDSSDFDFVLIMDGDGEDNPMDAAKLLNYFTENAPNKILFARRDVRSEPTLFKIGYFFYRSIFRILTGKNIKFGNFSVVPKKILGRLTGVPELWNHYASSILYAKIPILEISTERSGRIHGRPKMNLNSLLLHGFSSIATFYETLLLRLFILFSLILVITFSGNCFLTFKFNQNFIETINPGIFFVISFLSWLNVGLLLLFKLSLRATRPCIPKTFWHHFINKK